MSRVVLLDAGPLGLATNPKRSIQSTACAQWLQNLAAAGARILLPEIADYEVRRELLRANKTKGTARLDALAGLVFRALVGPGPEVPKYSTGYQLILTPDEVACEHPGRQRESIRWDRIERISVRTTIPSWWDEDIWLLFEGDPEICSVPAGAKDFSKIFKELKLRFPGFDYQDTEQCVWNER